jgi:Tol biopolymer transport system component
VLSGGEADARSDIFAFGAVVYEMLTGRRAFDGKTQASVAAAILKEEPRPMSELQPMTPPALERLVRTCLAKDPEDRWQRMHDVLLQLRWVVEGGSQAGVPAPVAARHRWREKAAWAAAAAFLLAAAALGAVAVGRGAADVRVVRAAIPPPEGTEFNLQGIQPGPVAVSPDGRRLAFAARDASGRVMLWVRPLDAAQAQMLSGTEGASYPFWSPDGKSIGFFGPGMLRKIDAAGGPATGICPAPNGKGGTWSREGVILFAPAFNSSIHRVAAGGGTSEPVTELDTARGENSHRFPQFLPDGRGFIFFVRSTGGPSGGSAVKLGELGTKETRSLMPAQSQATYASGRLLFVQDGVLMARALDPGRGAFTGDADPVVDGVRVISGASRGVFAAAEDGVLAYQQGGVREGTQLAWMDRAGTEIADVGGRAEYQNRVSISPDGRSAAVVIADASSGTPDIWTVDLARGVRSRVTFHPGAEIAPVWSPDGRRIAFSADHKEGRFDIYAVTAGGAGEPEVLFASGTGKFPSSWSPDGRHILYSDADTSGAGNLDVWALPLEGDRKPFPILRSRFTEDEAAFAPDGRWIAYMSDESGRPELYVAPFPGTGPRWQISLEGGDGPRWRRDGREIFFVAGSADLMSADVSGSGDSFVVGEVRRLPPRISSEDYDAAPDGRRFLVIPGDEVGEKALITLVLNWPGLLKS